MLTTAVVTDDSAVSLHQFAPSHDLRMKIAGIFSNLSIRSRDSADLHTRQYVDAIAAAGADWSIIVFADGSAFDRRNPPPGNVTVLHSSRKFPVLAAKVGLDVAIWKLSGHKRGIVKAFCEMVDRDRPDLLLYDGLPVAPLSLIYPEIPAVLACVDAMSLRQLRLAARTRNPLRLADHLMRLVASYTLEKLFLGRVAAVHVVSEVDAAYLQRLSPRAKVYAIPIVTPVEARAPLPDKDRNRFVLWGDVSVSYLRAGIFNFLKTVPAKLGGVRFVIVGRHAPDPELKALIALHPNVEFLDWVDDLTALIAASAAVILPDASGTGIKNRTLHALALGTAVIGSPSALEGIPVASGTNAFECNTADEFVAAIHVIRNEPATAAAIEQAGPHLIDERYSRRVVGGQWMALLQSLMAR